MPDVTGLTLCLTKDGKTKTDPTESNCFTTSLLYPFLPSIGNSISNSPPLYSLGSFNIILVDSFLNLPCIFGFLGVS